ncbi:DUF6302 family protein [Streptomyces sp. NPDC055025]
MQHTAETDRAWMLERLADPSLLDQAVEVPVSKADGKPRYRLTVPVGGARRAGYLAVNGDQEARAALAALKDREGFPSLRVQRAKGARDPSRTVIWGERPPSGDAAARWRFYGYSDAVITRYEHKPRKDG